MWREGRDLTIFALGTSLPEASGRRAGSLRAGIDAYVAALPSLRPLDAEEWIGYRMATGAVVTVEEHSLHGGLGSLVSEILADRGHAVRFDVLAFPEGDSAKAGPRAGIGSTMASTRQASSARACAYWERAVMAATTSSPLTRARVGRRPSSSTQARGDRRLGHPRPHLLLPDRDSSSRIHWLLPKRNRIGRACVGQFRSRGGDPSDIATCGISNQSETFLLWDDQGVPLSQAVSWQCERSVEICERLRAEGTRLRWHGERVFSSLRTSPVRSSCG